MMTICKSHSAVFCSVNNSVGIFNPSFGMDHRRTYTICPNTTIPIGINDPNCNPLTSNCQIISGGKFPLVVLNPNTHFRCGENGASSENCVLSGGWEQLYTLVDSSLLEVFLGLLRAQNPNLPQLPAGYIPDSSNLLVEGLTFTASFDTNTTFHFHSPVLFQGPGTDMKLSDCVWKASNKTFPPYTGVRLAFSGNKNFNGPGLYSSLELDGCLFEDNIFAYAAVSAGENCVCDNMTKPQYMGITVKNSRFNQNVINGAVSNLEASVIHLSWATGSVSDSCLTNNVVSNGLATVWDTASTISYSKVFGDNNTVKYSDSFSYFCPDIGSSLSGVVPNVKDVKCTAFDAGSCPLSSAGPTPSMTPVMGGTAMPSMHYKGSPTNHPVPSSGSSAPSNFIDWLAPLLHFFGIKG